MIKAKTKQLLSLFAIAVCLLSVSSIKANIEHAGEYIFDTTSDKFVGGWSYTVEGAPEGYKEGLLTIIEQGDGYKVQVQVGAGTLLGENVNVSGSTITFDLMVEGSRVGVSLTVKGDTISGTSSSPNGNLKINGKKTISMD